MKNNIPAFGKKDAAKSSTPITNRIGLDTRPPEICEECIYYDNGKCKMPGGCGRQKEN